MDLTLDSAQQISKACLRIAKNMQMKPITTAVLVAAGSLKILLRQDGASTMRPGDCAGQGEGRVRTWHGLACDFSSAHRNSPISFRR